MRGQLLLPRWHLKCSVLMWQEGQKGERKRRGPSQFPLTILWTWQTSSWQLNFHNVIGSQTAPVLQMVALELIFTVHFGGTQHWNRWYFNDLHSKTICRARWGSRMLTRVGLGLHPECLGQILWQGRNASPPGLAAPIHPRLWVRTHGICRKCV